MRTPQNYKDLLRFSVSLGTSKFLLLVLLKYTQNYYVKQNDLKDYEASMCSDLEHIRV